MKSTIATYLEQQPFLVLDGSLSSELEKLGADLHDPLWSAKILVEAPDLIRQVHDIYLMAGADIICTSTYQASFAGFSRRGIDVEAATALFGLSVELAREVFWSDANNRRGRQFPLIAASLGPYGAHLADGSEYRGDYDLGLDDLIDWHRPQMTAIHRHGGADLLLFETIPSLLEAKAIAHLLKQEFPAQDTMISFSVADGSHISGGEKFAEAVEYLSGISQVVAIGINCTAPRLISELLSEGRTLTVKPLMVYPNSGEYWNAAAHCWHGAGDLEAFSHMVGQWYQQGAGIIGGCCRTGPEHTQQIRAAMDASIKALQGS